MKVILFMTISLNGVIARENNEEDFISHRNWLAFVELANKTGCIIWGRKTHEIVGKWGKEYWTKIEKIKKVIISTDKNIKLEENCISASSPEESLKKLSSQGFNNVILSGGGNLNSSFVKKNLIDEIVLNIEPVLIGAGIPVFKLERFEDVRLELIEMKKLEENITQLHYKVLK